MIRLNAVSKVYRGYEEDVHALKDVTLQIEKDELVAVVGTSGSGKSTLLNILGGLDRPTDGEYYFDGMEVSRMNVRQLHDFRKENVSFVFQNYALISRYTVYENMEIPLLARNVKGRRKLIMDCLEKLNIAELAGKYPIHLSGGQQQRCAIGRAILLQPRVILCDEPTGALDNKTRARK